MTDLIISLIIPKYNLSILLKVIVLYIYYENNALLPQRRLIFAEKWRTTITLAEKFIGWDIDGAINKS